MAKPLMGERVHGGLNIGLTERFDRRDIREDHKAVKALQCQDDRQQHGGHTQTTVRFFFAFFRRFCACSEAIRFILPIAGIGLVAFDGAFLLWTFFLHSSTSSMRSKYGKFCGFVNFSMSPRRCTTI